MYEFEDGSNAEVKQIDGRIIVFVYDVEDGLIEISGFPSEKHAHDFVMFGDFSEQDNDFVITTKPNFKLEWVYK